METLYIFNVTTNKLVAQISGKNIAEIIAYAREIYPTGYAATTRAEIMAAGDNPISIVDLNHKIAI
jgi:ribosomal protein L12E/L44/L45/RPP1/RPP2